MIKIGILEGDLWMTPYERVLIQREITLERGTSELLVYVESSSGESSDTNSVDRWRSI